MKRSEAIKNLLMARAPADLAALYNSSMEVQVNVAQDGGDRTEGDYKGRTWHGWSDGVETWKSFRVPHNAKTIPEDNDYPVGFDLAAHAEGIGMTGWDWREKVSRWVAFDFDGITGHSDKHEKKLPEAELRRIQEVVSNIPWITVRLSTGGKGLHLYVFLDPAPATQNHCEHAAVARAILGLLAALTGFDFQSKVDVCGGNMWVWHRKMLTAPTGLSLVKQGIALADIPTTWRDHINVVSNRVRKTIPSFITDQTQANDIERLFEELTSQKSRVSLDEEHQKLTRYLHETQATAEWLQDQHMLITHTHFLKLAHTELAMRGVFETSSPATDLGTPNCFLFPMRRGAWAVRRYTPGVAEASTWDQDGTGWTRCFLNAEPNFLTAVRSKGGVEHKSGGFVFREAEVAVKAVEMMGIHPVIPPVLGSRRAKLSERKDGKIVFEIAHDPNDRADQMDGWIPEKGNWTRIYRRANPGHAEPETGNYDDIVRHLITESQDDYGWMLKRPTGWGIEPLTHVRSYLGSFGLKSSEATQVIGACIAKPWRVVCRPFQPEILGDRDWNRNAPQLAYSPTMSDTLSYPRWLQMLNHCGRGLDEAVRNNPWARANAIHTGADYLKCWMASLIKEPTEPLPYLFFYGPQNCGKSIFHESIGYLLTCGVQRADNALISQQGFNGEIENAVLCVVEETDMSKDRKAYDRIKDWVTSPYLPIHEKGRTPYSVPNVTHWVQTANHPRCCPVLPGDSRITMVYVDALSPTELIPKKAFREMLCKEAPDFLASLLNLELPSSGDRLNVPVIETSEKKQAQNAARSYLDVFLEDECHHVPGSYVFYGEFYEKFQLWLEEDQLRHWNKMRVGRELPPQYPKGRSRREANKMIIGNLAWKAGPAVGPRLVLVGEYLEAVDVPGQQ